MPYFDNRGCRLHYQEHGAGAPLLLIHGLGSSGLDWELQTPALSERYHVLSLDLRGHGRSDKPSSGYSIKGFAEDVAALIEQRQLGPVHLVGISMGGMVGFQLAVERPELLRSLGIVNSSPEAKANSLDNCFQIAKHWSLARLFSMARLAKTLAHLLLPKPEHAQLRHKLEQRWSQGDKRAYLASLNAIIGWGVREQLQQIQCPTLIISGDRDYTSIEYKAAYVAQLPNARLLVIEDSRHATPMDQPQRFNCGLLDFLAEVERVAPTPNEDQAPC